jgi:hypothetical protein
LKLSAAAALVGIPDDFRPAKIGDPYNYRTKIFVRNREYIRIFLLQDGSLYSKEYGYMAKTDGGRLTPDSSVSRGPAILVYYQDGSPSSQAWAREGEIHRDSSNGPALVKYHKDGDMYSAEYRNGGRLHRPRKRGPALYYERGSGDIYFGFWEDGICIAEFEGPILKDYDQPLEFFESSYKKVRRS